LEVRIEVSGFQGKSESQVQGGLTHSQPCSRAVRSNCLQTTSTLKGKCNSVAARTAATHADCASSRAQTQTSCNGALRRALRAPLVPVEDAALFVAAEQPPEVSALQGSKHSISNYHCIQHQVVSRAAGSTQCLVGRLPAKANTVTSKPSKCCRTHSVLSLCCNC